MLAILTPFNPFFNNTWYSTGVHLVVILNVKLFAVIGVPVELSAFVHGSLESVTLPAEHVIAVVAIAGSTQQ